MKPKICKGTGDAKDWGCGEPVLERRHGLGVRCCFKQWLFSEAGKKELQKSILTGIRRSEVKRRKCVVKMKNNLTNWRVKTETKMQLIARLIDKGLPCAARGSANCQMHGGHVLSKGGNKSASLNAHNIHRQSAQSNKWFNDDALFRYGIGREYGLDYLNFVLSFKKIPSLNYSNNDYLVFYRKASKIALTLKKRDRTYSVKERIKMRNVVNRALGIYTKETAYFDI